MIKKFVCVICIAFIVVTCLLVINCDKNSNIKNVQYDQCLDKNNVLNHAERYSCGTVTLLGVVQGVTEFLPISSTGHMILIESLFDCHEASSKNSDASEAMKSYFAIIQSGSILAILMLYWQHVRDMLLACCLKSKKGWYLIRNLMLSFLPVAALGILFNGILQNIFYAPICIACALIFGALLIIIAESKYQDSASKVSSIDDLKVSTCIKIGMWQCLALIPGMSRSMSTIVGGYFCGLNKKTSAEYSFLLGFITLSAATFFKLFKDHEVLFKYFSMGIFLEGIVIAFIFSVLTMRLFISYLNAHGLKLFAWYRILLGLLVLFLLK